MLDWNLKMSLRNFRELISLSTFEDRYEYLRIGGVVGSDTFGAERYLNQAFYTSREWKNVRHAVIARDEGCDMSMPGYEIYEKPIVHHMNPISVEDVMDGNPDILNPEYLVLVSHQTHNAIHYGNRAQLRVAIPERFTGDTQLWTPIARR